MNRFSRTWRDCHGRRRPPRTSRGFEFLEPRLALAANYVAGEIIVQFAEQASPAAIAAVRAAVGGAAGQAFRSAAMVRDSIGTLERVRIPAGADAVTAAAAAARMPGVLFAEPNYRITRAAVSNDPFYATSSRLWGMYGDDTPTAVGPAGTTNQFGSQAEKAWNAGFTGSKQVFVGVIDEGVDITHPDLAANIWVNPFETPNDGIDNDGNGYVDDVNGWDFDANDKSVYDGTFDDHGTHVAGTIGGVGSNGVGVAGVSWNVTLIPAKFLGRSGGATTDAIAAIDYLTDLKQRHNINIVATNNSWGGGPYSAALHSAIIRAAKAGILFVAAAGNSSRNNDTSATYPTNYSTLQGTASATPATYEAVISVAAITSTGALASFSNYGATTVDIGAPGSAINSTLPGGTYGSYNGTSMAAPHVTGAVALYAAARPAATASEIRAAILGNARATPSLAGKTVTGGRLDVFAALNTATGPVLSIGDVTVTEGNTGATQVTLTVTLSTTVATPVTVQYATADGTATTADADYVAGTGAVTFPAGQTQQTITLTVNGDAKVEPTETFAVTLSSPVGATLGRATATVTITNDDAAPVPTITVSNVAVTEGNSGTTQATLTFVLSTAAATPVTVRYTTGNGSATTADGDYVAASGTVSFATGETQKTVSLSVRGDTKIEPTETFMVNLSNAVGATLAQPSVTVTITTDDTPAALPTVTISGPDSVVEGNAGTRTAAFTVELSRTVKQVTTVQFTVVAGTATAGADFRAATLPTVLVFSPNQWLVRINVGIVGDRVAESDETFRIVLSNPVGAVLGSVAEKTVTIANDDGAAVARANSAALAALAAEGRFAEMAAGGTGGGRRLRAGVLPAVFAAR